MKVDEAKGGCRIGHLKQEHRMDPSRLKEIEGGQINAILSAERMNFGTLFKATSRRPSCLYKAFVRLTDASA